jgi:hypothetical protein
MVNKPMTADAEALARAVNATDWTPLPSMVKRQCLRCGYFFAAPSDIVEPRCLDCTSNGSPRRGPAAA